MVTGQDVFRRFDGCPKYGVLIADSIAPQQDPCSSCECFQVARLQNLLMRLGHADFELDENEHDGSVEAADRHARAYDEVLAEARRLAWSATGQPKGF